MFSVEMGQKLRMLRENFGYTQQHMAKILNIDRSTYTYYELGRTSPSWETLFILAKLFGVGIEELLGQDLVTMHQMHDSKTPLFSARNKDITSNDSFIYNLSAEEKQLIAFYRISSEKTKHAAMKLMEQDVAMQRSSSKNEKS